MAPLRCFHNVCGFPSLPPRKKLRHSGGWTDMAAVMRLVNRSTLGSAMGQQYLAFSSASKVKTVSFLVLLSSSRLYCARLASSLDGAASRLAVSLLYG